jgi:DNA-binding Xre family transcriptional regulator
MAAKYAHRPTIRVKLQELMERGGWTVSGLSRNTGLSRPTIRAIRDNERDGMSFDSIAILCKTLHCDIEELLAYSEEHMNGTQ